MWINAKSLTGMAGIFALIGGVLGYMAGVQHGMHAIKEYQKLVQMQNFLASTATPEGASE